jgi:hypothetical protein
VPPHFGYTNHQFLNQCFPNTTTGLRNALPQIQMSAALTLLTFPVRNVKQEENVIGLFYFCIKKFIVPSVQPLSNT